MSKISRSIQDFVMQLFGLQSPAEDKNSIFVRKLMKRLSATADVELACDEVFEVLDLYAEAVQRGDDAGEFMPLVKHHLEMCIDCHEEFDMLFEMMGASA